MNKNLGVVIYLDTPRDILEKRIIGRRICKECGTTYNVLTGVNMPKLHDVILYANSKSKIKVLQSIGRGLRKHATKNQIILYDIIDDLSYKTRTGRVVENYLIKHWKERMSYYKEQEFPVISTSLNI